MSKKFIYKENPNENEKCKIEKKSWIFYCIFDFFLQKYALFFELIFHFGGEAKCRKAWGGSKIILKKIIFLRMKTNLFSLIILKKFTNS